MDACKVVKGLEPKFGYFVTKAAEAPKAPEKVEVTEEIKPEKAKKDPWEHHGSHPPKRVMDSQPGPLRLNEWNE